MAEEKQSIQRFTFFPSSASWSGRWYYISLWSLHCLSFKIMTTIKLISVFITISKMVLFQIALYPREGKKENKAQQKYLNNLKITICYHLTIRQLDLVLHSRLYNHILLFKKNLNWFFRDKIKLVTSLKFCLEPLLNCHWFWNIEM